MSRRDTALKYFEEQKDYTDFRVKSGIEQYRKGNEVITIKDKNGNPVKGVKIIAEQKNHEFKFGANIFMLDEFEKQEKNTAYRKDFAEIFNLATVPFYWSDLEPEEGKPRFDKNSPKIYRRPAPDLCVEYCKEKGIEPKCHCLNYDNFIPKWLSDADVGLHKRKLEKRFREIAERYADVIPSFEVTNETLNRIDHPQTKFYREDDFVEWSFRMADKYFPENRLVINDYVVWEGYRENRSQYYMQIERLINNGISHLDSIGFQFHSFNSLENEPHTASVRYNPEHLYKVMDKYAQLGKKLQITEMTIPAYSNDTEDEDIQAEILKNVYSIFFSHPAMEAAIYWNLVDGYAAVAPQGDMSAGENKFFGGLMRFDMSKKPSYYALKELFTKTWHTKAETETDENGNACFRGFYGDYDIKLIYDGKEIPEELTLSSNKNNITNIVL